MLTKTVLITGASSGFGEACARKFAAEGHRLILAARRTDRIELLAEELGEQVNVLPLTLDVRERESVDEQLTGLPAEFSVVDVLVNNAGLALGLNLADKADLDHWDTMVDTNIKGLMYCTRAILPGMVARGAGHVVNIGSVAASWPYPGGNAYGGTKAFVQQFSRNLRADLVGKNIRVSLVEPGMCDTEFSLVRFEGDAVKASSVYEGMQPLTGKDVADIVYWTTQVPPHINVNQLEVMPVAQAWSPFSVHRDS
ncbi:MAG: SDR family oxidoreductase [Gammaproteobacteria bacterium]|jgi:3-hydroxy acid dehydrogenase / malonic semialdehyde reductase|nr:SDR family oxidoreductase [Gammaproteobacteria bacterium]